MLHNNYVILRNLIFGDKKKENKINKKTNINSCIEIKKQLDECLSKNVHNCIFLKTTYENCIKINQQKVMKNKDAA